MANGLVRHAPAKINLALHVTGRRDDGYHLLESLVVFTRFGDTVEIGNAGRDALQVTGPFGGDVPAGDDNLVLRARDRLRELFPEHAKDSVSIRLDKQIPVAAGVGGGSSDAAAVLAGLSAHWRLPVSKAELRAAALPLGADIPMCLAAVPLMAKGIGDEIDEIDDFPELPLVLVNPRRDLSTARVFAALARRDNAPLAALPHRRDIATVAAWLSRTRNDLEAPAISLVPEIGKVLGELRDCGCLIARMSGSGATCYGLFAGRGAAENAFAHIRQRFPDWFTTVTASGAAGGSLVRN